MDEARRFLRYVLPGLVFGTETLVGLLLALPDWTLGRMDDLSGDQTLGVALGGLLASGGLGYVFSAIHHTLVWHWHADEHVLNDLPLVERLLERRLIPNLFDDPLTNVRRAASVTWFERKSKWIAAKVRQAHRRRRASEIAWWLWYERKGRESLKGVSEETDTLGDMAHSLGTARIASFFALVAVLLICFTNTLVLQPRPMAGFGLMLLALCGATYCFCASWRRVGRMAQGIFDIALERELEREPEPAKPTTRKEAAS